VITVLDDSFDSVTPPTLPGWTATNAIDPDGIFWQSSNTGLPSPPADSPPNATWINDPAVGGTFVTGGYNSTIATGTGSPLAGRQAWSGNSGGFITTTVNLPLLVVDGVLRWRIASGESGSSEGWRIDNVIASYCHFTGLPSPTPTSTPRPTPTPRSRPTPPSRPTSQR